MILHIALPVPLRRHFDYLPAPGADRECLQPGVRISVPFGKKRNCVGLLLGVSDNSDVSPERLKKIIKPIDTEPLFDPQHFRLLRWASDYYQYPLGDAIFRTLPAALRRGQTLKRDAVFIWRLNADGAERNAEVSGRAVKQNAILRLLKTNPDGLTREELNDYYENWRTPMNALIEKGLVCKMEKTQPPPVPTSDRIELNREQKDAVAAVADGFGSARRFLLYGVTGSGKTEIYIELIKKIINQGKQAIILVPEIGLTPQFINRLKQRLAAHVTVLHSGLSDSERLQGWMDARDGTASVVLGTRSAIWTPLKRPGIFIIDEEHDPSYKQQDTLRYSARDVAVMRGKLCSVPVVLGSATPSMESVYNARTNKFTRVTLNKRAGTAPPPQVYIVDLRGQQLTGALSGKLIGAMEDNLNNKKQTLLFLNRRGFSPVIMCHSCGWIDKCSRCDIPLTFHKHLERLVCHHCGSQRPPRTVCDNCRESQLIQIGHGTERLADTLKERFPSARILRIDRDSTRRKGSMEAMFNEITAGQADILVGTQMLAKGHHFPKLTLVGIIDADQGLFSADFRASERMAQLIMQVSGRAGRADDPGSVMIQTHYPNHPLLRTLTGRDYEAFAELLLEERRATGLPPFAHLALLRAEGFDTIAPARFLRDAGEILAKGSTGLEVLGPVPAPMEKRAGRYRFQLLVQSANRAALHETLRSRSASLQTLPSGRKVRWSLDVDPQDML